jgi:hypothetical protein
VTWIVWCGIGLLVAALVAVSWWYDRDARGRGATPLTGAQMARGRRQRDYDILRQETSLVNKGVTPRSVEDARRTWNGS